MNKELSHIDKKGNPGMVDVSTKTVSQRMASASGKIRMPKEYIAILKEQEFSTKKGGIAQTAIIAATMAVKKTYENIPFCHQIPISSCKIFIDPFEEGFSIQCIVKTNGRTGVEMEALQGVSTAALTIYDMCKALGQEMRIENIQLDSKSGGKNDYERKT